MSYDALDGGSLLLRRHITRAVQQRGLFAVLRVAFSVWIRGSEIPPDMPARLRADAGLPPDTRPVYWPEPSDHPQVPPPMWRPGL